MRLLQRDVRRPVCFPRFPSDADSLGISEWPGRAVRCPHRGGALLLPAFEEDRIPKVRTNRLLLSRAAHSMPTIYSTNSIIDRLIVYAINRGVLTA